MNDLNKKLLERLLNVYHFTQYGKLMPGFIHNINGKITGIDSQIQLYHIKAMLKLKKLEERKESLSKETYEELKKEYQENLQIFEKMKVSKNKLNQLIAVLNNKVAQESLYKEEFIDINRVIREFHKFFCFYKIYKHDTEVIFDLKSTKFPKMQYKDFNFILYVATRNAVDSTIAMKNKKNILIYKTYDNEDEVVLNIEINGSKLPENYKLGDLNFDNSKKYFGDLTAKPDEAFGAGLDLFFASRMIADYEHLNMEIKETDNGNLFILRMKI